jgi:superfamily II DNA or RNA helicase
LEFSLQAVQRHKLKLELQRASWSSGLSLCRAKLELELKQTSRWTFQPPGQFDTLEVTGFHSMQDAIARMTFQRTEIPRSAISLADRCRKQFLAKDWSRGCAYFADDAVTYIDDDEYGISAEVEGSSNNVYHVVITWQNLKRHNSLDVSCTCGRFDDGYLCKHIAATILAVDDQGINDRIPGAGPLKLEFSEEDLKDDGEPEDDWQDEPTSPKKVVERIARTIARELKPPKGKNAKSSTRLPDWQTQLRQICHVATSTGIAIGDPRDRGATHRVIHYVLDLDETRRRGKPLITFYQRPQLKGGGFGVLKPFKIQPRHIADLPDDEDRLLLGQFCGNVAESAYSYGYAYGSMYSEFQRCELSPAFYDVMFPRLCASGRFGWAPACGVAKLDPHPLSWDDGPPWQFRLHFVEDEKQKVWSVEGRLWRGETSVALSEPQLLLSNGLVIFADRLALLEPIGRGAFQWVDFLRNGKRLQVPKRAQDEFVRELLQTAALPAIDWPDELRWDSTAGVPTPRVVIRPTKYEWRTDLLWADVFFQYDRQEVRAGDPASNVVLAEQRRVLLRDKALEQVHLSHMYQFGFTKPDYYARGECDYQLPTKKLSSAVDRLTAAGWKVEAEGKLIRTPGTINISVTSGVDWFDLNVECDFDGIKAALPDLLAALEHGKNYVELGDGTRGMLPMEWLNKYGPLTALARPEGDSLRFLPSQAMILDALLAAQPHADLDQHFVDVRKKLHTFDGVKPQQEPDTFQGELRPYQRDGLGWLMFLRDFGFGGCLADDMGLGKTVQVLALLENRRLEQPSAAERRPSLVVAPRSLIFNWLDECQRFTPNLRALNYTGLQRGQAFEQIGDFDLVVTTYGTLRRDIVRLREVPFDYAILDEAQAIKNGTSQAAKASRLLTARHRLAMTGTPVENQLGDLWSLFEFLNPGMLGRSDKSGLFSGKSARDPATIELLGKALRPFLLRRTKENVLADLPQKTEQTLFCELDARQRKLYNDLRDHYRALLTDKIKTVGLARAKIHVLEALLRLRQAACHPALIDPAKKALPSAKNETLLAQLREVLDEGHKALVFSQFTSFLALVRKELDQSGITYEYLDGKTRDRKEKVERFQNDADCRLFLISLKAGGQGLNLTAADYVFILDPWWNPAVEAQAVDRAHRIGQSNPVFAYRLIAKDTVEEKILQLQGEKRKLAEAIVSADENLIRTLTAEDLKMLLS